MITSKTPRLLKNKEAIELISFKITLVFLEKVLVVFKNNKLSEGKWMGHIGIEIGGVIDQDDGKNVVIKADFSSVQNIWNNPQRLLKNANPKVKLSEDSLDPNVAKYNVNDIQENILLFEYQLNPKEIKLIPLSVQYRTAIMDGMLRVKIFMHANPKLPTKLFDIEVQAFFKEKEKLTLKQSSPQGVFTKEKIQFNLPGMVPDQ